MKQKPFHNKSFITWMLDVFLGILIISLIAFLFQGFWIKAILFFCLFIWIVWRWKDVVLSNNKHLTSINRLRELSDKADVIVVTGVATSIMQVMHPLLAAGIRDHSTLFKQPEARLFRTLFFLDIVIYGSEADKKFVVYWLQNMHQPVKGKLNEDVNQSYKTSTRYGFTIDLQCWVLGVMAYTLVSYHKKIGSNITERECDLLVAELFMIAKRLGVPKEKLHNTWKEFEVWFDEQLHNLPDSKTSNEIIQGIIDSIRNTKEWRTRWMLTLGMLAWIDLLPRKISSSVIKQLNPLEKIIRVFIWSLLKVLNRWFPRITIKTLVRVMIKWQPHLKEVLEQIKSKLKEEKLSSRVGIWFQGRSAESILSDKIPNKIAKVNYRILQRKQLVKRIGVLNEVIKYRELLPNHLGIVMDGKLEFK